MPVEVILVRLGLDRPRLRAALVVMRAVWALAERRLARLGAPPREPVWEPTLRRPAPSLAAAGE